MSNRKKIVLLVLPLTVIVVLLGLGCLNKVATLNDRVGNRAGSIVWDGLKRTFLVHIPPSYDENKSMPLVIALHGGGGSAKDMVKLTKGGFNRLADKEGFIVVYPEGTEHPRPIKTRWNDGRDERFSQADDVGFISALIEYLAQSINIDRARIYATGMSNGAHMSMRLARELSDKIVAVAPAAYSMPKRYEQVPVSTKSISFLIMVGTDDPITPWQGGNMPDSTGRRMLGEILSVPQTVGVLVSHNQCSSTSTITYEADKDPQDGTRVRKEVYENGKDGTEVVLYAIEGGGHTWPGGWQYLPERYVGKTSRDIDANEVIWNFFKKHVRIVDNYLDNGSWPMYCHDAKHTCRSPYKGLATQPAKPKWIYPSPGGPGGFTSSIAIGAEVPFFTAERLAPGSR